VKPAFKYGQFLAGKIRRHPITSRNLFGRRALSHVETAPSELILVSDEDLQRLAEECGPGSAKAQILAQVAIQRAQDIQIYNFRVDDQYITGPLPRSHRIRDQ
jgi:hypothetical protein